MNKSWRLDALIIDRLTGQVAARDRVPRSGVIPAGCRNPVPWMVTRRHYGLAGLTGTGYEPPSTLCPTASTPWLSTTAQA